MSIKERKVYLFKAAPEEEMDTILSRSTSSAVVLTAEIVNTNTSFDNSLLQQPDGRKEVKNDTTTMSSVNDYHGQDMSELGPSKITSPPPTPLQPITPSDNSVTTIDRNVTSTSSCTITKDRFITLLNSSKIENQLVPVMTFEYSNLDELWRHLKLPAQHSGIILTSPRCVHSITEAIKAHEAGSKDWEQNLRKEWESKYLFCVGPSTVSAAELLFPYANNLTTGIESHAESLANTITEVNFKERFNIPLLYPCGTQRRDVLLQKLCAESITCTQCIVYESVMNRALETVLAFVAAELKDFQYQGRKKGILCFFSPSGVNYVFQHLDLNLVDHNKVNVVAIGPTTKAALEVFFTQKGIAKRIYQCETTTPESLLNIVMLIDNLSD